MQVFCYNRNNIYDYNRNYVKNNKKILITRIFTNEFLGIFKIEFSKSLFCNTYFVKNWTNLLKHVGIHKARP